MNQNNMRLYGILVDISGSMKQCYQQIEQNNNLTNQIQEPAKTRLVSVWEIIQAALQKIHLQDDFIFLSAFGCRHEVEVIDLVPFLKSGINILKLISQIRGLQYFLQNDQTDYCQLLYKFVTEKGAKYLSSFYTLNNLKTDISNFKAKLLYLQFKENEAQLKSFVDQLPKQVKKNNKKYKIQAFIGSQFQNNGIIQNPLANAIQKEIQNQLKNLDNYIQFNDFFDQILQCLSSTLIEVQNIKNKKNNTHIQINNELKQIIAAFSGYKKFPIQQQLHKLEELLKKIDSIQDNILKVLNNDCFIPQDLIKEQINFSNFQINSIDEIRKQIQIQKDLSQSLMIKEDFDLFKPFESISYGGTPLIKCLKMTFNSNFQNFGNKFLFILSDGDSTDGNPIQYTNQLKEQGFTIFCFYITSSKKIDQNQLYSKVDYIKGDGAKKMFEMSSEYSNFEFPLRQIEVYTKLKLSEDGKSRLFLQSNDPEQLKQFFDYFMKISKDFDKLIEMIGRITLEKYINSNREFEPHQQNGGTCYANSIAAVYSIMISKIYKREGEYPGFFRIRDLLIQVYGTQGAKTFQVVEETCQDYRLQCRRLKTISQIKQALHQGRPIISRFVLCEDQWKADNMNKNQFNTNENQKGFIAFFNQNRKGILSSVGPQSNKYLQGHSVVLISYTPEYYLFINSWGKQWGDNGYFKVKDLDVLGEMEFMEVFWDSNNLTESEKQQFKQDTGQIITKFYKDYLNSIGDIKYSCPKCNKQSFINQYQGNYQKAQCPKCNQEFHPKSLCQLFFDYLNGKNI
ncbi:unnamed protein product [Paramecium pentaurelia]|uniref:Peptidase C1A papain C-terminal domain-containing protein n=1 Tax=Paramecium pentaurelia TaxID=43138 RepID=A0A8S1XHG0_9CILI|nr:unnamed protein product [Paramecium pentaurelia]